MARFELLKHNLPIEADLQNFVGYVMAAAKNLGGNPFAAARATFELTARLRKAGAATGYPLPARLMLYDQHLVAEWGEEVAFQVLRFEQPPDAEVVEVLRSQLERSQEVTDPEILFRRNVEMMRYLDETRERTEGEIRAMQHALHQRQAELWESIRLAETDPLTGLLNRRAYDERLEQAFRRTVRQTGEYLSLVLLDLDYFKQINDEFGHQYGDEYLKRMAAVLRKAIRSDVDFAFRFGGDEFALLVFGNVASAGKRALQVLRAMDGRVSIGVAGVGGDLLDDQLDVFIRRADDALYEAKRAGRGRIVVDRGADGGRVLYSPGPEELQA